jgi:two-component system, NtrC family, sensor kinase
MALTASTPTSESIVDNNDGSGTSENSASESLDADQQRTLRLLLIGIALAVIVPILFFAFVAEKRYHQIWQEQEANAERVSHIVTEHALKLFDTNQVLLQRMEDLVDGKSSAEITAMEPALHQKVRQMAEGLPQVQSLWIMDENGHPLVTNRFLPAPRELDLSDRESFKAHRSGYDDVFITGALLGKRTREVFFDLTRRRATRNGAFAGTVQVSLYPKYLVDFYRDMVPRETSMAIAMTKNDGTYIARFPQMAEVSTRIPETSKLSQAMRKNIPRGTLSLTSMVDGIERSVTFRKVGAYPVFVSVGIAHREVLGLWRHEMIRLLWFAVPAVAAIGLLGLSLLRRTKQQFELSNKLYAEVIQRREIEHALLQSQKMEALGHLTGGVAHDFNNLLMTIDMSTHVLADMAPHLKGNSRLDAIHRAVDSGAKLTRQLLSFSSRQPLSLAPLSLQVTLPAIIELCRPVLGRNIEVRLDVDPATPAALLDRAELELAVLNLAINAKHAMPGGGMLELVARPIKNEMDSSRQQVELQVRDTGTGIASELLAKVLEPFFTTRKKGEGTGLGLSQVKTMCERAGGSIRISSEAGKGTTVQMLFPATAVPVPQAAELAPGPELASLRVLLVEDNEEIATATQLAMISMGCTLRYCASADEAIGILSQHAADIDVVLSDITMPGTLDGIALARHIHEHYPSIPVALMTGYAERIAEAEKNGLEILAKPFGLPTLRDLLHRLSVAKLALAREKA